MQNKHRKTENDSCWLGLCIKVSIFFKQTHYVLRNCGSFIWTSGGNIISIKNNILTWMIK